MLLAFLPFLGTGGTGRTAALPAAAHPTTATDAHRATHVADLATSSVANADGVTVRTVDVNLFPFAIVGGAAVAALLAVRLRREQGSYTLPWGTGSTSTRGPPVRPVLI